MNVLTVRERDQILIGSAHGVSVGDAEQLALLAPRLPNGFLRWEHRAIRLGPFCGVLQVGSLAIEILPKLGAERENDASASGILVSMLQTAGFLKVDSGIATLGFQRLQLLDIFILDFCDRVASLFGPSIIRSYQSTDDELPALRGRLRVIDHIRQSAVSVSGIHCRFDDLSVDNPHNRVLKAVLSRIQNLALGGRAKSAVVGLLRRMEGVATVPCSALVIDRLYFDRITEAWRPVFQRAAWFLRGMYPDVRAGNREGVSLLFNMERLFEAFVGEKLRREWQRDRGSHRLLLQGPPEYLGDSPSGAVFRLRPDAALVSLSGKVARLYDAKWKALDRRALSIGVAREDVYQLATYAAAYGSPVVSLIYPQQAGFPDGLIEQYDLRVPGSPRLEIILLDLGAIARGGTLPSSLRSFANPATTEIQELGVKLNAE